MTNAEEAQRGFIELSSYLTGVEVDAGLAAAYRERIAAEPFGDKLDALVQLFRSLRLSGTDLANAVREQIVEDGPYALLARQIILLWYTSAFSVEGQWKFGTPDQHFRAHIWPVVGAHPLALSGGYFGYWKYPPEN